MIGVLADDFSGAAEIAGVAVRHGLTAAVSTEAGVPGDADLVVIDTETRSREAGSAADAVRHVLGQLAGERVEWLFKKVDSVLRGPVVPEIAAVLSGPRFARALLVPANPGLGRIIRDGRYFIDGRSIDETEFAHDPEFPVQSASVLEMLGAPAGLPICVRRPGAALPEAGVIVGEAESGEHLRTWAGALDERTLAVGAAAFFTAVLGQRLGAPPPASPRQGDAASAPALAVSGSASTASRQFAEECDRRGRAVLRLPVGIAGSAVEQEAARWAQSAADAIERHGWVLLTLAAAPRVTPDIARAAHAVLVRAATSAVERVTIRTLYVEGGATAAALARALAWSRFDATAEYAPGVVALRPHAARSLTVIVKPGSYRWPADLLN